jgi:hypothetical protein
VSDEAFAGQHQGFFGITTPHLDSLWSTLTFPRGLLMESPFLLLVPLGLYRWLRASHRATLNPDAPSRETDSSKLATLKRWLMRAWATIQAPDGPEAFVSLAVIALYPLAISSYFLPMAGENLPGPRLLVPMLPFACLALIWVVDHPRRWLRIALAASLVYGVAMSYLFVALGVRIYHTYTAFPLTELYWPLISSGAVPARNGSTPQSLFSLALGIPRNVAFWFLPVLLAIWTTLAVRAVMARHHRHHTHPAGAPAETDPAQASSDAVTSQDMVAASR